LDTKIEIKRTTFKNGKINLHDYEYYAVGNPSRSSTSIIIEMRKIFISTDILK